MFDSKLFFLEIWPYFDGKKWGNFDRDVTNNICLNYNILIFYLRIHNFFFYLLYFLLLSYFFLTFNGRRKTLIW